jgi:ATP-dependent helicase HrpB
MEPGLPLAAERLIVTTDLDGAAREARVRQAAALDEADLRAVLGDRIRRVESCVWSDRDGRVLARRQERLGALVLAEAPWPDPPPGARAAAALDGLRAEGLPWTPAAARLRARAERCRAAGMDLPPLDDSTLLAEAGTWLLPWLDGVDSRAALAALDLTEPLRARLGAAAAAVEAAFPSHFTTPLGRRVAIDYDAGTPGIEIRLQELFGQTMHPVVGPERVPLRLTLLSPGGRPVAVTTDLPGFWSGGYRDVRRDMRGRYPRHPWPEDPAAADPTLRAKPRGS